MRAKKLHEPSGEFTTQAIPRNTDSSSSDVGLALKRSVEKQSSPIKTWGKWTATCDCSTPRDVPLEMGRLLA